MLKITFLFITFLVETYAFPSKYVDKDMSIFFEHVGLSARLIGGTSVGVLPYMVALTTGEGVKTFHCGGSLITTRHILTAAHCIVAGNMRSATLRANVGSERYDSDLSYVFSSHIIHTDYNASIFKNDIGILVTSSDVALSDSVSLVSLNFDFIGGGVATFINGWGRTGMNSPASEVLLQLSATVIDGDVCVTRVADRASQLNMRAPAVDPRLEICVFNSNTRGMCSGDSGSPLMRVDTNQQIGLMSWGLPCVRGAPDIFVRISAFQSWIEENIRQIPNQVY